MLEQLLRDLNSRKKAVREAAIREARALPPEQLLQLAEVDAKDYKRRKIRTFIILCIIGVSFFALNLASVLEKPHRDLSDWVVAIFRPFQIYGCMWLLYLPTRRRRSLAQIIATTDDPRFIGPALALIQKHTDAEIRQNIRSALKYLLPKMRAEQAELLTPEQRHALLIPLQSPYDDTELTLSILKALEQVGDEKAIPVVARLTEEGRATRNMRSVKQAAIECLPYLKERADKAQQAQTLLRASDATVAVAPEMLLRPAMANADDTPPDQLLRAAPTGNQMR